MVKKTVRPYYEVSHEFSDSQKAYHDATMMLYNAVDTALSIVKSNPEMAGKAMLTLTESAARWRKVALGDDEV